VQAPQLSLFAVGLNKMTIRQSLLDHGADANVQGGRFRRSALLLAATAGSEETVKLLLAKGADVNARDSRGYSPLQWALSRGETSIAKLLAGSGAKASAGPSAARELPVLQKQLDAGSIQRALSHSVPLLQQSAQTFSERKSCVSCHHQPLVAMAVASARKSGVRVDDRIAAQEQARVLSIMDTNRSCMLLGGGVSDELAPAYILSGLAAGEQQPNAITDALVHFLILRQQTDGSWRTPVYRPPQDASNVTFTALTLRGLSLFAPKRRAREPQPEAVEFEFLVIREVVAVAGWTSAVAGFAK
jgi:hypothetical protein